MIGHGPLGKKDATLLLISERPCLEFPWWGPFAGEIRISVEQIALARQIIRLHG